MDHRALGLALLCASCAGTPAPAPAPPPCVPACQKSGNCADLDSRLEAARTPLLACIGEEARHGRLAGAHRCYRSLRFLESARWWLRTLLAQDGELARVYQPAENVRLEFLCRIEQLTRARTAPEVERLYLDTISSYP